MKASIVQRRPNGDIINIQIEPLLPSGAPKIHQIKCERTFIEDRTKQISTFILDSENECWTFLQELSFIFYEPESKVKLPEFWKDNNLHEILA